MKNQLMLGALALAFSLGGTTASAQVAHNTTPKTEVTKADPQAYELLRHAQSLRESFPRDFIGFKAELVCNDNGKTATGTLDYTTAGGVKFEMTGLSEATAAWLKQELSSLLMHRRAGDFAQGDGRHPLTLPADDHSPLGRQVLVNDKLKSSYRIRENGQTAEVDRTMGPERIVITILETTATSPGKFMPRHFVMNAFDAKTSAMLRSQTYTEEFARVEGVWLPASRRIVTAEEGKLTARVITIRNAQLHKAAATPQVGQGQ